VNVANSIPVTIVSGYLGAGKTTLVNNALRKANGLKLAILVNEFGNLAIDEDLIISQDENMISLAGGCICCSYGNDMLLSLKELASLDTKPDHIILEASGVAIPSSIEQSISLIGDCYTESIVSIIDSEQIQDQLSNKYVSDTILAQIESADLIFANKIDLILDEQSFLSWVKNHYLLNKAIRVSHSEVELDVLLGVNRQPRPIRDTTKEIKINHTNVFWSEVFIPNDFVNPIELSKSLTKQAIHLVRAKGHLRGVDGKMYLLQTVGHRYYVEPADNEKKPGLVLIGTGEFKNLDVLRENLKKYGDFDY
jgi:G3E family GTPase